MASWFQNVILNRNMPEGLIREV